MPNARGAIVVQPLVPGFTITGELGSCASSSSWSAVRTLDDERLVLKIVRVPEALDLTAAMAGAAQRMTLLQPVRNEHLVRQHDVIALADGSIAMVLDRVAGGTLARVLGARRRLTAGETVTTVAPLFGALADLHAAGVVHGGLSPQSVSFSADGRPLICDLGLAALLGWPTGSTDRASGFVAPETVDGAPPSPASDVYSMAAIGWFCLSGAAPDPAAARSSLAAPRPASPSRLVEVLAACLSTDPMARPSAAAAAVDVFDATPAASVALGSLADPALEITRRIRAAAASAPAPVPASTSGRLRRPLVITVVALLVAALTGIGATWFLSRSALAIGPVAGQSVAQPSSTPSTQPPKATPTSPAATHPPRASATAAPGTATAPSNASRNSADVVTSPNAPRVTPAALLQALVDARALAYLARDPALLDLVFAPGASMAEVDRTNIATARKNGATYIGLGFVVKDAAFLDGAATSARIRATIVTLAYATGQPDGRRVPHARDVVGPSVFTLSLTPDGWRILALARP